MTASSRRSQARRWRRWRRTRLPAGLGVHQRHAFCPSIDNCTLGGRNPAPRRDLQACRRAGRDVKRSPCPATRRVHVAGGGSLDWLVAAVRAECFWALRAFAFRIGQRTGAGVHGSAGELHAARVLSRGATVREDVSWSLASRRPRQKSSCAGSAAGQIDNEHAHGRSPTQTGSRGITVSPRDNVLARVASGFPWSVAVQRFVENTDGSFPIITMTSAGPRSVSSAQATFDVRHSRCEAVHANLVGYITDAPHKAADLYYWMEDGGARDYASFEGSEVFVYDVANDPSTSVGTVAFGAAEARLLSSGRTIPLCRAPTSTRASLLARSDGRTSDPFEPESPPRSPPVDGPEATPRSSPVLGEPPEPPEAVVPTVTTDGLRGTDVPPRRETIAVQLGAARHRAQEPVCDDLIPTAHVSLRLAANSRLLRQFVPSSLAAKASASR